MIVRIDKHPDGSYYCSLVSGSISVQEEAGSVYINVETIELGTGVDFSKKLARDFVHEWILERLRSTLTRFDRILEEP